MHVLAFNVILQVLLLNNVICAPLYTKLLSVFSDIIELRSLLNIRTLC
jgi:hypothetical protein